MHAMPNNAVLAVMKLIALIAGGVAIINAVLIISRHIILSLRQSLLRETRASRSSADKVPELPDRVFNVVQRPAWGVDELRKGRSDQARKALAVTDWEVSRSRLRVANERMPRYANPGDALGPIASPLGIGSPKMRFPEEGKEEIGNCPASLFRKR